MSCEGASWSWPANNTSDLAPWLDPRFFYRSPVRNGGKEHCQKNRQGNSAQAYVENSRWPSPEAQEVGYYSGFDLKMIQK